MKSNDSYFADSWFIYVKITNEAIATGVNYCGPEKMTHKGFCLVTLEQLMKYWLGGSYLVMTSTPRVPGGRPILAIGYTYKYSKVLGFIANE